MTLDQCWLIQDLRVWLCKQIGGIHENHGLELIYIVCVNIVLVYLGTWFFDGWVTSSWRTGRVGYGIVYFRSVSSDRIGYISLRTENRQKTAALSIGYFGVETSVFKASRIDFEKECSELIWKHRLGCPGPNLLHPQPHTWLGAVRIGRWCLKNQYLLKFMMDDTV